MNRSLTALFAALEALLVVGIGVAIPLLPLTVLWVTQYGLQVDWVVFWRAAVDIWLLGSGVDITMTLNPVIATSLAFPAAGTPFLISIAPLGFGLLTLLLGARAGRRLGEIHFRALGFLTAAAVFAAASVGVASSALWATARASLVQSAILPALVFVIGLLIGLVLTQRDVLVRPNPVRALFLRLRPELRAVLAAGLRGGTAAVALLIGASALIFGVLLVGNYARIIALYEAIHSGVLGGITLTVGQLSLLPNLIIWAASWLVGPGFALGSGSTVSPLGTTLGPIPAIPVLGALPGELSEWSFIGLLVPVLAGFVAGLLIRGRVVRALGMGGVGGGGAGRDGVGRGGVGSGGFGSGGARGHRVGWLVLAGALVGVAGAVLLGLLAWASSGAAGPGRLVDVGPQPFVVAAWAALEFGVAAIIALLTGRASREGDLSGV